MQDNLAVADGKVVDAMLFGETGVYLFYFDDFEDIENAFGKNNAYECLVCERCV